MEGGIDYLRSVIIDDKLGLNDHLEEELARLRAAFACEWTETVNNPAAQTRFKHFINSDQRDPNVQVVPERDQHRPATPYERIPVTLVEEKHEPVGKYLQHRRHPAGHRRLRPARSAAGGDLPSYHDDRVFAISNIDPFFNASVLSRGIIAEHDGALWVASPLKNSASA